MELRHLITFGGALVVLQLLLWNFTKTVQWLGKFSPKTTRRVGVVAYVLANGLAVVHILQIYPAFRLIALLLTLLLFVFLLRLVFGLAQHFSPSATYQTTLRGLFPLAFFALVGLSIYNAYVPRVIHTSVEINKPLEKPLRIGVASDLHLGHYFGAKHLDWLAEIMQSEKVDLILLAGDIMDDNTKAYLAEKMSPHLAKLRAPLGVYATLGNHDYYVERQKIAEEIQKAGIQLLSDEAIEVNHQFILVGRNDDLEKNRPSAAALLANVKTNLPVFLVDHRPTDILAHAQLPIDLQVSGHTHNGQIFPMNWIVKMMYPLSYGYQKINEGHFFVTSGYGFWGIPMRLGSQSEIWVIDVKGK